MDFFTIHGSHLIVRAKTPSGLYFIEIRTINSDLRSAFGEFAIYIHAETRITLSRGHWKPNTAIRFRALINGQTASNTDLAWTTRFSRIKTIVQNDPFLRSRRSFSPFLARLEKEDGEYLIPSDILSIHYSIFRKEKQDKESARISVEGHWKVKVPLFPWFLKRPVVDYSWNKDTIGYNFLHFPSSRIQDPFPQKGSYLVQYDFVLRSEEPVKLFYTVNDSD